MHLSKIIVNSKIHYNILAIITGYIIWNYVYTNLIIIKTFSVPIYFYNTEDTDTFFAPNQIAVTVKGPQSLLTQLSPGIHIDADTILYNKKTWYTITQQSLFLPYEICMAYSFPTMISITKIKQNEPA
jgi:hypothetical protein